MHAGEELRKGRSEPSRDGLVGKLSGKVNVNISQTSGKALLFGH